MEIKHNKLEELFDCLYHERTTNIPKLVPQAKEEMRFLTRDLPTAGKRKLNFIGSLLNYCEEERWNLAKNQLGPAEQEYHRYFVNSMVTTPKTGHYEFHSRPLNEYPHNKLSHRGSSDTPTDNDMYKADSARPRRGNGQPRDDVTSLDDVTTPKQIAEKFQEIYDKEWKAAIYELEQLKIYEARAIGCLLSIVMDAYRVCKIEADNQMTKLENAAFSIVMEGTFVDREITSRGDRKCLLEYRRGIAYLCLERLQESFRRRYLPEIIRSVGVYQQVRTYGPVNRFANQCVALCWKMVVIDPPIHLVDQRYNPGLFNREMYQPYTRAGQAVAFYVWPALLKYKDGPLLAKGVAQGQ